MTNKIETSVAFWEQIIKKRNFDEKGYDLDATNYIKKQLGLLTGRTILTGLKSKEKKSNPVELEEFIKVFFESMKSFSDMMVDLLNMFEEIDAKKTDKNLDIKFDFDKGKMPYTISLEHFKASTSTWQNITKEYSAPDLTTEDLWDLLRIIKLNDATGIDITIKWLDTYEKDGVFNTSFSDLDMEENSTLGMVFIIWKDFVKTLHDNYKNKETVLSDNTIKEFSLVSNKWIEQILKKLICLFENKNIEERQKVEKELVIFFREKSIKRITVKEKIKKLEEFLKLPFWDKRYELYSVWIFTLIYRATKDYGLIVHTVDNTLIFPFKETHLATIPSDNGNILIFSEKRTKLINPVGKSRSRHIQPDYSFYKEPITDTKSSILEIECKQYKKQGTDNFARALIDYANGRENADIYLVNYGSGNKSRIFTKIDELAVGGIVNNKERCTIINELKPNMNEEVLKGAIQSAICDSDKKDKT